MSEEWLPFPEMPTYEVSDLGRVRRGGRLLKPFPNGRYLAVHLHESGERAWLLHRLVATVFVENPDGKPDVGHLNHDPHDCRAANLSWVTPLENMAQSKASGRRVGRSGYAVIGTAEDGSEARFPTQSAAERALGTPGKNSSAVHHCLIGKKKSAYGYTWRRA